MGWVSRFMDDPIDALTDNKVTENPLEAAAIGAGLYFGLPALTGMEWGAMGDVLGGGLSGLFSPTAEAAGSIGSGLAEGAATGMAEGTAMSSAPLSWETAGIGSDLGMGASEAAMTDIGAGLSGTTAASLEAPVAAAGGIADADMAAGMLPEFGNATTYGNAVAGTTAPSMGLGGMWDQAKDMYNTYGKPLQGAMMIGGGLQNLFQNKENQQMYRQNMSQVNNLYTPGSPEAELMRQQMERADAAKGRRSQYGTRETELAARLAQARLGALTSGGYQQSMQGAAQSGLNSYAGIAAGLGQLFGSK